MTFGIEESVDELRNSKEDGSLDTEIIDPILDCGALGTYHSFDGWGYRIDDAGTDYEHIHLFDNREHKEYDQYSKGNSTNEINVLELVGCLFINIISSCIGTPIYAY